MEMDRTCTNEHAPLNELTGNEDIRSTDIPGIGQSATLNEAISNEGIMTIGDQGMGGGTDLNEGVIDANTPTGNVPWISNNEPRTCDYLANNKLPKSVMNLSSGYLHKDAVSILAKGLKFVPTPSDIPAKETYEGIDRLEVGLKRHIYMSTKPGSRNDKVAPTATALKTRKLLFGPSKWKPPATIFDKHVHAAMHQLRRLVRGRRHVTSATPAKKANASKNELDMLAKLHNHPHVIVKSADKGSATVVMDKQAYEAEAVRQLVNKEHYLELPAPQYTHNISRISQFVQQLHADRFITDRQRDWFMPDSDTVRARKFYLLPKIHKDRSKWPDPDRMPPGRPIVSDVNSENYRISSYVDYHLAPLATSHPAYLKDTWDFLDKLRKVRVPANSFLVTMDVNSLYTNINNREGMAAVRRAFAKKKAPQLKTIAELMEFILSSNDFEFNEHFFLQISGTAMGKIFAPHYADIYMADWEREALKKCKKQPFLYLRYLDDIFIIWTHSKEDFLDFFNTMNQHHPSIKLTYELSAETVNFLDVTVFKGTGFKATGILDTKVYFKPTDTHELLHRTSYHPRHTFEGIIKSQVLRFYRICSISGDFDSALNTLLPVLFKRGYSRSSTRKIINDILSQAKYVKQAGTTPCMKAVCTLCCLFFPSTTTVRTPLQQEHDLMSDGDCDTKHCIYALVCRQCTMTYVGQTGSLRDRLHNHLSDIRQAADTLPALHLNDHGGCNSVSVRVLQQFEERLTPIEVQALENTWIKKLQSLQPNGLNAQLNPAPTPVAFITPFSELTGDLTRCSRTVFDQLKEHIPRFEVTATPLPATSRRMNIAQHIVRTTHRSAPISQLSTVPASLEARLKEQEPRWSSLTPQQWIDARIAFIKSFIV